LGIEGDCRRPAGRPKRGKPVEYLVLWKGCAEENATEEWVGISTGISIGGQEI